MKKANNKVGIIDKNDSLREFFKKQFDFCWENQKINYETREKLLRIYIPVLSILPASLIVLYKFEMNDNSLLLIFALIIIIIFSLLTWIRNLSLRRSIIRYRKSINYLSIRLLEMEKLEDSESNNILNNINIPSNATEEPKSLNISSGDTWLIVSLSFISALSLGFLTFILVDNWDLLISSLKDIQYCVPIIVFVISFFSLNLYMVAYFCKYDNE